MAAFGKTGIYDKLDPTEAEARASKLQGQIVRPLDRQPVPNNSQYLFIP
jgi:hypothetical protein